MLQFNLLKLLSMFLFQIGLTLVVILLVCQSFDVIQSSLLPLIKLFLLLNFFHGDKFRQFLASSFFSKSLRQSLDGSWFNILACTRRPNSV